MSVKLIIEINENDNGFDVSLQPEGNPTDSEDEFSNSLVDLLISSLNLASVYAGCVVGHELTNKML